MNCRWVKCRNGVYVCSNEGCGREVRTNAPERYHANCQTPRNGLCRHQLDPTGEQVEVGNCGCASATAMTALFGCELHGLCAPLVKSVVGRDDVTACKVCRDWLE